MPIPDYQSVMLPLLKYASDGNEHFVHKAIEDLAKEFKLTDQEKKELLPSGQQAIFPNRVGWARTYLKKAGLLESPKRGYFKITKLGLETLTKNLDKINVNYLKQFPDFLEFQTVGKKKNDDENDNEEVDSKTPREEIEIGYKKIRQNLVQDVLKEIKKSTPSFFEKLVVDLLVKMGYGGTISDAGKIIGKSGDEGIDGIIKEDKLGLDIIYIQAKKWENSVSRPEIQKFVGALAGQQAKKGVFITLSNYSTGAIDYAEKVDAKIILINGEQLAQYMIDFNVGVSVEDVYEIKKVDSDYFNDE